MELIAILLLLSFLRYAKRAESINVNEWLTAINTKRNRILILAIIILFDLTPIGQIFAVLFASLAEDTIKNFLIT